MLLFVPAFDYDVFHVVFKCRHYAAMFSEHCPQYDREYPKVVSI